MRERNSGVTDYDFPRLYLKGEESGEYALVYRESASYKILRERPSTIEGGELFGLVPYETGWFLAIDPLEGAVTRGMLVVAPWLGWKGFLADEGTRVDILEVKGYQPILTVREGDHVDVGDVIAYVLTSKGETRTARSNASGLILYVSWRRTEEEVYNIIVVDKSAITELKRLT